MRCRDRKEAGEGRALALIEEAGFALPEVLAGGDEEARAYWAAVEGCAHFEATELLGAVAPSYDGSPEDDAARLDAVAILRERVERLRDTVENDENGGA